MDDTIDAAHDAANARVTHDAVYRKISWRLLPFLLACYIINYLDRVSIGYAKLQFQGDLHPGMTGLEASAHLAGQLAKGGSEVAANASQIVAGPVHPSAKIQLRRYPSYCDASVISDVSPYLAAKDPIGPTRVHEDRRQ